MKALLIFTRSLLALARHADHADIQAFACCRPLCGWSSCCTPPAEDYIQQPYVQQQMSGLANAFLALLPPDQALPAAGAEARWLADTAVVQSAAIARDNRTVLFGWLNNILVNSNLRDGGCAGRSSRICTGTRAAAP
ncbi:MAG: hypothetical protein ACLSUW_05075 [Akkermansia sp.]